jgi:excinuclease ABC subunit B
MAIMYADRVTESMRQAIDETARRRNKQLAYNASRGIVPRGVTKRVKDIIEGIYDSGEVRQKLKVAQARSTYEAMSDKELTREVNRVEREMLEAARHLEFERAADLRNRLAELKQRLFL